jgi:hypothetical protein
MNLIPIRISALADHSKADELQRFTEGQMPFLAAEKNLSALLAADAAMLSLF